jgi:hypothetical protein
VTDNRADLRIAEPISGGLSQLGTVGEDLTRGWPGPREKIKSLNAAMPWGDGHEGAAFALQYLAGGGPDQLLDDTDKVVEQIGEMAPRLRKTIGNSLSTDAALQASMRKA